MTINAIITIATLTFALGFVSAQAHSSDDEPKVDYFCCDETIRDGSRDRGFDCEHVTAAEADECQAAVLECRSNWTWTKSPNVVTCLH